MDILQIPGYAAAVQRERVSRDAAFLGLTETVGPFELLPLSLYHYTILRLASNPLLYAPRPTPPTPDEVALFLWLLCPGYTVQKSGWLARLFRFIGPRARFLRRCRKIFYPPRYLPLFNTARARARYQNKRQARLEVAAQLIDAARAFVKESLQDRSPTQSAGGFNADYFSDIAYFRVTFGREFKCSLEELLHMPMKVLFQYNNVLKYDRGSKVPLCNPSDDIRAAYLRGINKPQNSKSN